MLQRWTAGTYRLQLTLGCQSRCTSTSFDMSIRTLSSPSVQFRKYSRTSPSAFYTQRLTSVTRRIVKYAPGVIQWEFAPACPGGCARWSYRRRCRGVIRLQATRFTNFGGPCRTHCMQSPILQRSQFGRTPLLVYPILTLICGCWKAAGSDCANFTMKEARSIFLGDHICSIASRPKSAIGCRDVLTLVIR